MRDKLRRFAWSLAWAVLFRPSPRPLYAWRRFLLRCFGAVMEKGACPYPSARVWAPWNLVMREGSCLAERANCYNVALVTVGARAVVSQGAYLCTASHDYQSPRFELLTAPIAIEEHCWVATEAFVGPGVTLHRDSVVLARAVVIKDVAAAEIVAGNPAKFIGNRHTIGEEKR